MSRECLVHVIYLRIIRNVKLDIIVTPMTSMIEKWIKSRAAFIFHRKAERLNTVSVCVYMYVHACIHVCSCTIEFIVTNIYVKLLKTKLFYLYLYMYIFVHCSTLCTTVTTKFKFILG